LTFEGVDYRHGQDVPQLLGSIINAIFDVLFEDLYGIRLRAVVSGFWLFD
jgi:hypothetical protein